tara:strand:- start:61 stop:1260 length:1200 start_codon:yes stop_codon:yes gene_type:complete
MTNKEALINPWPHYSDEEKEAVLEVLKSGKVNYWTGNNCSNFEESFANYTQNSYSIALANGTLALESAYYSIGISDGDEIITTPRTFIATAMSIIKLRGKPIFADIDKDSGCITAKTIEPLINKKTKAISVVHLAGWPANMIEICDLAKSYNLFVIEDCAQAHGAKILVGQNYKSVGSFGDVNAWSFCQDKIMSTGGEGGMVTTNSKNIQDYIWSLKDHGKAQSEVFKKTNKPGYRWVHKKIGSNYRMTEMQAAIGLIQLKNLDKWQKIRERNANILIRELSDLYLLSIPTPQSNLKHAWYKFYCYLNKNYLSDGWSREKILSEIIKLGYQAMSGSCSEVYLEECMLNSQLNCNKYNRLNNARLIGETSLMFVIHPTITEKQMYNYADSIRQVLIKAQK